MNYHIDDVIKDDKGITVRGYVIGEGVKFRVLKKDDKEIPCEVKRFKYKNVFEYFAEAEAADSAGFFIHFKADVHRLRLEITTEDEVIHTPIHLEHDYSKKDSSTGKDALAIAVFKAKRSLKRRGVFGTFKRGMEKLFTGDVYERWQKKHPLTDMEIKRQEETTFSYEPKFSVVVPLFETPLNYLEEMIESVKSQTYKNWELVLSDGGRPDKRLKKQVEEIAGGDKRIIYIADSKDALGISENTNQAISAASGDYIILGDHDDLFTKDAFYHAAYAINEYGADVIYSDEDKTDSSTSKFFEPHFKPDFNIGFFRSNNYICHMFVVKKEIVDAVGFFNPEYNGAQDYDFILRCTERAEKIYHIPRILYHWRFHMNSTSAMPEAKLYAYEAGTAAVSAHYKRLGIKATVKMGRDYGFYETEFKYDKLPNICVIKYNNSATPETLNELVKKTTGEFILFQSDDIEIKNDDYIEKLYEQCMMDGVGAVGARIYNENGSIYHAGKILGLYGSCGNLFENLYEGKMQIFFDMTGYVSDYSGVSGLLMMTRREDFLSLGGFDVRYMQGYYDMDYCLRLRKEKRRVVYQPKAIATLKTSQKALPADEKLFKEKWKEEIAAGDEYYNKNLSLRKSDWTVDG